MAKNRKRNKSQRTKITEPQVKQQTELKPDSVAPVQQDALPAWLTGLFAVSTLLMILTFALFLRLDQFADWQQYSKRFFFAEPAIPLMLTVDAYYYIDLANDLLTDQYEPLDSDRFVPQVHRRPHPVPLMSVVLATLAKITGQPLEWLALFLPAFFGLLLALPVYLFGYWFGSQDPTWQKKSLPERQFAGHLTALTATLIALVSPAFFKRSMLGWFDTDPLNVVFATLVAYLALRFCLAPAFRQQISWLVALLFTTLLFLWWWDQAGTGVLALTGWPLLIGFVFFYRPDRKTLIGVGALFSVAVLVLGLMKGWDYLNPMYHLQRLLGQLDYFTNVQGGGGFPIGGDFVSEQKGASFSRMVELTAGAIWPFTIACLGWLGLVWRFRLKSLFLSGILIVLLLSGDAMRFAIFGAPLIGLGIGFATLLLWQQIQQFRWTLPVVTAFVLAVGWPAIADVQQHNPAPRRYPYHFEAMRLLAAKTPADAVIWASWGHGHPLTYYSQRGTIADGIYHPGWMSYVINFAWTVADFRLAANWMQFYVQHGFNGLSDANTRFTGDATDWANGMARLQQLLAAGPTEAKALLLADEQSARSPQEIDALLAWLFPTNTRPIFMFLEDLLIRQAWYKAGAWDLAHKRAPRSRLYLPINQLQMQPDKNELRGVGQRGEQLRVDLATGQFQLGNQQAQLASLFFFDRKNSKQQDFQADTPFYFDAALPAKLGVLAEKQTAESVLNKLFIRLQYDQRFFAPVAIKIPRYQIWQVMGDQYSK